MARKAQQWFGMVNLNDKRFMLVVTGDAVPPDDAKIKFLHPDTRDAVITRIASWQDAPMLGVEILEADVVD